MFRKFKARTRQRAAYLDVALRRPRSRPHGLDTPLIVSLTSYPSRYATLVHTLRALLRQTVRPDMTILWIEKDHQDQLPSEILDLKTRGLSIGTGEKIRSYNKIIPVLREYPGATIVTADDDIYYPRTWLEKLVAARQQDAECQVLCHRGHRIALDGDGVPSPYKQWQRPAKLPEQSRLIFPTGVMGVMYGPDAFHPDMARSDLFTELSPTTDDVWLYWMTRLRGHDARKIESDIRIVEWPGSQATNLRLGNIHESGNDNAIAGMIARYGFP